MITNNSYLAGLIHRGMREELMKTFDEIYILNLHGNFSLKETSPDGSEDKNVFDIKQGVAISIYIKNTQSQSHNKVNYAELWGDRDSKYKYLYENDLSLTQWVEIPAVAPDYFFVPKINDFQNEYENGIKITEIFNSYSSGIKTHHDQLVTDFSYEVLKKRIDDFINDDYKHNELTQDYKIDSQFSNQAREILAKDNWRDYIFNHLYRPFDIRPIFYHGALVERNRFEVMRHMLHGKNLGLLAMRQVAVNEQYSHFGVTRLMVDNRTFYSNKGILCLFPLYIYPSEQELKSGLYKAGEREPNIKPDFITKIQTKLGLKFLPDGKGDFKNTLGVEDIFNYAYAIFHSPTYRLRYDEFLRIDFPRLPITSNLSLFKALAEKGEELVSTHLLETPYIETNYQMVGYPVKGSHLVEEVSYDTKTNRAYINKEQYFDGIDSEIWNFQIGGYQVCDKWLKDRKISKKYSLSPDDINQYQKIVIALKETKRLMGEIDKIIPGWPFS